MLKSSNRNTRPRCEICLRLAIKTQKLWRRSAVGKIDPKHRFLANIYLFKVNNRDTRITCKICKAVNKDIRTRSLLVFSCLYCYLWTYFTASSKFLLLRSNKQMSTGSLVVFFVHSFCFADEPTEPVYYLLQIWVKK